MEREKERESNPNGVSVELTLVTKYRNPFRSSRTLRITIPPDPAVGVRKRVKKKVY